jgi:release factor glutamine methyltransferase
VEISGKIIFNNARQYLQTNSQLGNEEISSIAFWLVEHYFGLKRSQILGEKSILTQHPEYVNFNLALQRLAKNEPIQYIIGETEFYGRKFKVNPAVLIPRPETEELVAWIIADYRPHTGLSLLDVGSGSGCIAISLAKELPDNQVFALDISESALAIAQENASLNQASIHFLQGDILTLSPDFSYQNQLPLFDCIVSNPPYVRISEKAQMSPNVLDFEPELALFVSDKQPLIFYQKICEYAHYQLVKGGNLYFEINEALAQEMTQLLDSEGFKNIEMRNDLQGKPRMIKGRKL